MTDLAGPVYVAAAADGDVVGEELQGDGLHDGEEEFGAVLHLAVRVAIGIDAADSLELEAHLRGGDQSPSRLQRIRGLPPIYYGVI